MKTRFNFLAKSVVAIGSTILTSIVAGGCFLPIPGAMGRVHPSFKADSADAQYLHLGKSLIEADGHEVCLPETDSPNAVSFGASGIQVAVNTGGQDQNLCQATALIAPIPYEFRFTPAALKDNRTSIVVEISGADKPLDNSSISVRADTGETFQPAYFDQCDGVGCKTRARFDLPCSIVDGGEVVMAGLKKNGVTAEVPPVRITWGADRGWLMCVID